MISTILNHGTILSALSIQPAEMKLLLFLVGIYALIAYQCLTGQPSRQSAPVPKPRALPASQPITKNTLDTVFVRSLD